MRNHVVNALTEMAETDARIMLVNGDLGYGVVDDFKKRFPNRYLNVGISEQNMTSVAAGLALEGNMVFTYSIGNFPTLRCIEQIRNDVCYHNANVKILSVGGGFPYGTLGMTHHATEDIAMMRALPNMKVYVPADAIEAVECLKEMTSFDGPAFLRMAKGGEPNQHFDSKIDITRIIPMQKEKAKVSIISSGTVLSEALKLKELLEKAGISSAVYSSPTVKPIDREGILELAKNSELMVSMEDHNVVGGFGSAIAEVMSEMRGSRAELLRIGLQDEYTSVVGNQDYIRDCYGISASKAFSFVMRTLEK